MSSTPTGSILNDISSPNVPWTPFAQPEWSSKYDSPWPISTIQSPNVSVAREMQNPFAQQHRQQQQQPVLTKDSSIWPSVLGTATTSSSESLSQNTQNGQEWDQILSSTIPSSTETAKSSNNSWLKFLPTADPPSVDNMKVNIEANDTKNPVSLSNSLVFENKLIIGLF